MNSTTLLGLLASILTSVSMLPQLIKIIKEKKSGNVSLAMPIVLLLGLGCWVWYGFLKKDWIIVGANLFSLLLNLVNLFFVIRYRERE